MKLCPCGSQNRYLECCGACLQKKIPAKTPEALMRSRYTAFVEGRLDYIKKTMRAPALLRFSKKDKKKEIMHWLELEVISSSLDPKDPFIGFVEFKAKYQLQGMEQIIHEKSEFHCIEGLWYYVDGISNDNNNNSNITTE